MLEKEIVIIGAGPAGLSASIEASRAGAKVLIVDSNIKPGGQLFKQIHKFFGSSAHKSGTRGINIGKDLVSQAEENGVEIWLRSTVIGLFPGNKVGIERGGDNEKKELITIKAGKIIIATGASENAVRFKGWTKPGVMGAGAAQTMVNVNYVRPGNKVVMVGSGNVGLIVSYQLMQAGCEVAALVEAAPKIGGYAVHAAKIRRAGVPIYVKHTITEVRGKDRVEEVIISEVNEKFEPIHGTEKSIKADVVAIGAGLKPSIELARLLNCELTFNPVFGGNIPIHNKDMETSNEGVYIAGDVTGVEEANTALEEGRIAGISAANKLGYIDDDTANINKEEIWKRLKGLRLGPFGERRLAAKKQILDEYETRIGKTICK
ncbi:NAD(P)/FAD-dependent oxidoreductase [Clostridium tyrobutyricum]|uniref:NAD(P)/FAD-dependent oxidoreductase n=2 Tax=Clostridium tyrobutyricum TaxID=1519 RepID=UPI00057E0978|nr:NAD(P)/FAD-dependent oxidoreductase [Clostridium tyrobutyricum]MBV4415376.1 NAD(P)/FAD-dependent oxidoreductase [Clostridium tyrobutyricum]MBV4417731.1 NAD(P)/FAD-dependent oxidoreductase [Clostridium tyrobutyricum]MBV4431349.1 NAD(P)/FAD-dependent oxidoreductase [Clostridium tyrobutyricum]MBV4437289.1 NAD(P)/FAD-dependent oxidoreductase [Clostridium tyrobutyricum]MEA5009647.1 NAD(P)/FAD-dependent oxidoreductase [Clostridium tyrobutyricum]